MNIYVIALLLFLVSVVVIEMIFYAVRTARNPDRGRIRRKLRTLSSSQEQLEEEQDIERKTVYSDIRVLNALLRKFTLMDRFHKLLYMANSRRSVGFYILLCTVLGLAAQVLLASRGYAPIVSLPGAALAAALPLLILRRKKRKRMARLQKQLPEALDLIARALKAGHAFSTGMKMAADEFDDPLGPEFDATLDQINFGVAVPQALRRLTERVECADLNFFVVAVILQRETGGNLAKIIENIAALIRSRFVFQGKVQTLAAEGVFSMYVLLALPFALAGALMLINPEYMSLLFQETVGHYLIGGMLVMMVIGFVIMRNMVKIEV